MHIKVGLQGRAQVRPMSRADETQCISAYCRGGPSCAIPLVASTGKAASRHATPSQQGRLPVWKALKLITQGSALALKHRCSLPG